MMEQEASKEEIGQPFPRNGESKDIKEKTPIDQAFERAGFTILEWNQISAVIRALVQGKQTESRLGQTIYGKPKAWDGVYYFVQKTTEGCVWSRIWMEGEGPVFLSLKKNPTPKEISNLIGVVESGSNSKTEREIAKEGRSSTKAVLANTQKKNGSK